MKLKTSHFHQFKNRKTRDEIKDLREIKMLKEKLADLFDNMDFVQTKRVTMHLYLLLLEKYDDNAYDLVDHTREYI